MTTFKHIAFGLVSVIAAFGQSQTPLKVFNSSGSLTGQLWLQERRTNGTNVVKLEAPQSIASDFSLILPSEEGAAGRCLVAEGSGVLGWRLCGTVDLVTTDYDWSQTPGGSLSVGANTVTLTPCPRGVAGTNTHHSVRISGGTGTAETVLITGGTCTSGASSGTITFDAANTHSGAWAAASASDGIQEAIWLATGGNRVLIPLGVQTVDPVAPGEISTIYIQAPVTITGANQSINGGSEIGLTHDGQWAIAVTTDSATVNYPVHFEKFSIQGTGLTTGGGIKVTATSTHNCFTIIRDMQLYTLPVGVDFERACGQQVSGSLFFGFTDIGLRVRNLYDTDAGDQSITNNNFLVIGASSATGISWESAGGAKIIGNKFNLQGGAIDMSLTAATIIATVSGNSFDNQKLFSYKARATSGFVGLNIVGNVVTGAGDAFYIAFDIGDNTTDALSNVVISGNNLQAAGVGVKVGDTDNVSIDGNIFGSFTTGVQVKAAATNVSIGKNSFYSVTTPYDISTSADVRPTAPLFASGYAGWAAEASNIKSIAEFAAPTSGAVNNSILFQTASTGTTSQRGIWWSTSGDLNFARFPSARDVNQTDDLILESDGDARLNGSLGLSASPATRIDVRGGSGTNALRIEDSTATTALQLYAENGGATLGTFTNHSLSIKTDSANRWTFYNSGLLAPAATDTYALGDPTLRISETYSKVFDSAVAGGTGDYLRTRQVKLFDNTGSTTGASNWDLNVVMSGAGAGQNSYFYLRDNGGNTVWRADKIASGSAVATTTIYTDLLPDSTANARDLGKTTQRWDEINGASLDVTGAANIGATATAVTVNATGSPAYRVNGTTVVFADRTASFTGIKLDTAAAATGYVWTATDADGNGDWAVASSGSTLPVVDTTGIAKGSSDATKIVRLEVDGLTTGTTRVVTVPDTNMTLAGRDVANTFTAAQTFSNFVTISGANSLLMDRATRTTSQKAYWTVAGSTAATGAWSTGTTPGGGASRWVIDHNGTEHLTIDESGLLTMSAGANLGGLVSTTAFNGTGSNPFRVGGTAVIDSSRNGLFVNLTLSGTVSSDLIPTSNDTYTLGNTSGPKRWASVNGVVGNYSGDVTVGGALIPDSDGGADLGTTSLKWANSYFNTVNIYGTLIPDTTNARNLGSSTRVWNNFYTNNIRIDGTVTPPSGTALNGTTSCSAGQAVKSITFSQGIATAITCATP